MVNSERNKTYLEQKEEVRLNSQQSELVTRNRVVQVTDSSRRVFRVEIFPLDTFSFSLDGGFRGRAAKIVIIGNEKDFQSISDSVGLTSARYNTVRFKKKNEIKGKEIAASKDVKSRASGWLVGMLCLSGVTVFCYLFFWIRRRGRNRKNILPF